jgi:hypothetical protein
MRSRKLQAVKRNKPFSIKFYFGICVIMLVVGYPGYFGEVDHLIPWQIDHLFSWRPKAKNAVEAVQN